MVDREIALKTVAKACLKLAAGQEVRLDKNVVLSGFPIVVDDRPIETRIIEFLGGAAAGVRFSCQRIANGDFVVARSTADAPQKPTSERPPPRQPQPAKPQDKQEKASSKRAQKSREAKRGGARPKQTSKPKR